MYHRLLIAAVLAIVISSCSSTKKLSQSPNTPHAQREFRAAWVATVANINWPSRPGMPVDSQKLEAIFLLDFLKQHNFNAVILQVRPQADALYQSALEPWSYYLTGKQGQAPEPYYDPLQFWIDESHQRGIEIHVWLNPYRAHHVSGKEVTEHSIVKKRPELVHYLKEGYWWMDPSMQGTKDHSTAVVMDIVRRYDIDGVHFDDYFYPYPSYNLNEDFPDSTNWGAYKNSGGKLSRSDWRRKSVNDFISNLYKEIKKEKKHVKFGLSPFGIWRPGYPEGIGGFDQHEVLYADARLWLNEGWIDYFTPQLYWPINRYAQSFPVLLGWWDGENKKNRHLWPGISVGRDTAFRTVNETISQIMISRGMLPASPGVVHWSIGSPVRNTNLQKTLLEGPYKKQALVPSSPWLDKTIPAMPAIKTELMGDSLQVSWTHENYSDVFRWVVYYQHGTTWSYSILNSSDRAFKIAVTIPGANNTRLRLNKISVTAVDRVGNESRLQQTTVSN